MSKPIPSRLFDTTTPPSLPTFKELCSRTTDPSLYPLSSRTEKNIPIYDIPSLTSKGVPHSDPTLTSSLQDEFHHILTSGPGILVLKSLYNNDNNNKDLLPSINTTYQKIISLENKYSSKKGDHFSPAGTNSRIWNSLSKHALLAPDTFIPYYSNPYLSLLSTAYLGPHYRITAQVNIVKPGGPAQSPHRDYHLGFQDPESSVSKFPRNIQLASQFLTLQGAVAHSDMPLDSGPTRFLPFSHLFEQGYLAYARPEFKSFFEENYTALELEMGDGVFFNPAVFHAAGANVLPPESGFERKANLLQISCGFGKTMESVDCIPIIEKCWNSLIQKVDDCGGEVEVGGEVECFVKAVGEGYPFPTNLDKRAPGEGGMAPESEQDVLLKGLRGKWGVKRVVAELRRMREEERGVVSMIE
ncbi:hypothetical protein FQN54_002876 [Arachnomyces sp. PD_36]|nr:hypothetical protein FQN54_002876 [Arachnomyces sp. PD_36]